MSTRKYEIFQNRTSFKIAKPFPDGFVYADDISHVESLIDDHTCAVMIELVQGEGGVQPQDKAEVQALAKLLKEKGVLLIVDEVQTGFARSGKMFAIENYGITPDIMTMAKALGNGLPISAFSTSDEIAISFTKPSASTLGGNPVSCAAAMAVLNYIKEHNLCEHSQVMGEYLLEGLQYLKERHDIIRDIRGFGLMQGAELVEGTKGAGEKVDEVLEAMKDKGILIGKNGIERNVLAFQPPLIIEKEDIDQVINTLDEVL